MIAIEETTALYATVAVATAAVAATPQGREAGQAVTEGAINALSTAKDSVSSLLPSDSSESAESSQPNLSTPSTSGQENGISTTDSTAQATTAQAGDAASVVAGASPAPSPGEEVVSNNSPVPESAGNTGEISDNAPATSDDVAGEPASTPPDPEDDFDDDYEEPPERTPNGRNNVNKPGSQSEMGNNTAENKQASDAANEVGLSKDQARQFHDEISGQGITDYKILVEIAKAIKGGQ